MKIGFIGLGVMGRPMAGHLIDAGHTLILNRVKPASQELVDKGGNAADTPKAVAEAAEVVILMVPDTPDVEAVLFGEDGVAEGLAPGKLVIDMSSISPVATKDFAKRIEALGCDYLDAPVSGGEVGAKNAALTIMVGGKPEAFETAKPLFETMGKNITHVGANGDGQTAKVANQIIVGLTIEAVAEALTFAKSAGADPAKVREALMGGFAGSTHPRGPRRADDQAHLRSRLPHPAAPQGPGARGRLPRRRSTWRCPTPRPSQQLMNAAIARGDGDRTIPA